nr:GHKL domain-containing protein [Desulfobacula sp.]
MVEVRTRDLEAANKELEAFTYSVSHDLRAPLRHINGYISLLTDRFTASLPEKGRHYLDTIVDSANQMGLLIDNLLHFSRSGRQALHLTRFDMNALFDEAFTTVQPEGPAGSIQWIIGRLPEVSGDYSLLKQVWINLLDNAVKFTKNKKEAKIKIGCREEDGELAFFVRDNGIGFDMQYAGKLFGVFQRLHSASAFEGTGIGLANVRRIILRHGGRTWAEAEPDKGAVFYFTLPKS